MTPEEQSVRDGFPSLCHDQVFLDNAGGSQALGVVSDSIRDYLNNHNVQLGASYAIGKKSTAKYDAAYEAGARYINANVDEVVFGASSTQLLRNLSYALNFKPGAQIVVSAIDHEANIAPWIDLAERHNLRLKWWKPRDSTSSCVNPELSVEDLERLISSDNTLLIACTHASNVLGTITDVKEVSRIAHKHGALVCVDSVAYAPHRPIDVKDLGVDFYVFSWYKIYGPHTAMLYASWSAQRQVRSLGHFFNPTSTLQHKLGLSGGAYELCQAIPRVVDYLGTTGSERWAWIVAQEGRLLSTLINYLKSRSDVTIYGVPAPDTQLRVATVSFTVEKWDPRQLVEAVEAETNHAIRWGSFYSERLVRETLGLGPNGVVRVSMVHYNTVDEIERLTEVLDKVLSQT